MKTPKIIKGKSKINVYLKCTLLYIQGNINDNDIINDHCYKALMLIFKVSRAGSTYEGLWENLFDYQAFFKGFVLQNNF